jgi:hypothetical protein
MRRFATARKELSGATDVVWSVTYNQTMNAMKLVLPIIFVLLFASNPVACLALAAALQGATLLYSLTFSKIYGSPPGSSVTLWYVPSHPKRAFFVVVGAWIVMLFGCRYIRNAALFVSFGLSIIGAVLVHTIPHSGVTDVSALNDGNIRRYAITAAIVAAVALIALLIAEVLRHVTSRR